MRLKAIRLPRSWPPFLPDREQPALSLSKGLARLMKSAYECADMSDSGEANFALKEARWGGRPPTASMCQDEVVRTHQREPSMTTIARLGIDTSKSLSQLHGVDE